MKRVKRGDTVRVHYTRRLADGTILDSSEDLSPVQFEIGGSEVVSGLARAVMGMRPGESRFTTITATEGFGPYQKRKVHKLDRREVPAGMDIAIGQQLEMVRPGGQTTPVIVKDISDRNVTVDANHPLAGMNLFFEVDLIAIL